MSRIRVNDLCNVLTEEDSTAYRSPERAVSPQITVPSLRARLSIWEARALQAALAEAVWVAEGRPTKANFPTG
jgi:hypothetical protein